MSRARLALFAIALAGAGFMLGTLWSAYGPGQEVPASIGSGPGSGGQDRELLALLASGRQTNGSAIYNIGIFNFYSAIWRDYGKGEHSPRILEIGPGANLGTGLLFVASGAKKYSGLDLFQGPQLYNRQSYAAAYDLLNLVAPASIRVKPEQIYAVEGDRVVFKPERMEYLYPRESFDIRLPDGSLDFVFSHSVFEHISDPDRTVMAIAKVLRRGGISAHHFDMRDHTDFSRPLEFLKADENAWRARFAGENAYQYTNRRRLSDFVRMIERSGLKILKVEPTSRVPMSAGIRAGLQSGFQKYGLEDLAVVSALIVAEKL